MTEQDRLRYAADISFVGSLYTEKSPLDQLHSLSEYSRGYIDALCQSQSLLYGCCFLEEALNEQVIHDIRKADPRFYTPQDTVCDTDSYVAAHQYIGMHLATLERRKVLERLGEDHKVSLYTRSCCEGLPHIRNCGGAKTLNEMPEYFEIGTDLETWSDLDELVHKADYYLTHEEERRQIARNGYEKVRKLHTYEARITAMLRILANNAE